MQILETKEIAMILQEETKPFLKTTAEIRNSGNAGHSGGVYGTKAGNNALMERVDMQYSPIQNPRLSYRPQVITKENLKCDHINYCIELN